MFPNKGQISTGDCSSRNPKTYYMHPLNCVALSKFMNKTLSAARMVVTIRAFSKWCQWGIFCLLYHLIIYAIFFALTTQAPLIMQTPSQGVFSFHNQWAWIIECIFYKVLACHSQTTPLPNNTLKTMYPLTTLSQHSSNIQHLSLVITCPSSGK